MYMIRTEPGRLDEAMAAGEEYLSKNRSRIVETVRSYEEQKRRTYSGDIAMVKLLTAVIAVLTGVTGLGIVGLAWFSVTQRRKQIGTRRALGARRIDIIRQFMLENWLITTAGALLGIILTVVVAYWLEVSFELQRLDWRYLPAGIFSLWVISSLSVIEPARRAASVPPAVATRSV